MKAIRNGTLLLAVSTGVASGGLLFDESVDGDISNNRLSPTVFGILEPGANSLRASTQSGDLEYVTFTVPAGASLTALRLTEFTSADDVAFLAIQAGTTFSVTPSEAANNIGSLLGWTHFGTGGLAGTALVGTDILDEIGSGAGSAGFTPPLSSGAYTLWIQQTQAQPVGFGLEFTAIPEPVHGLWVAGAILAGAVARGLGRSQIAKSV